jgi:hypothetical protein
MTVVRLKRGLLETHDRQHWGTRTDYLCARSSRYDHGHFPFWLAKERYDAYSKAKPTTGLCAVFEVMERLNSQIISVIGFDRILRPGLPDEKPEWLAHDKWAEHEILKSLGVQELHE